MERALRSRHRKHWMEHLGIHLLIWTFVAAVLWATTSSPSCTGVCAVSNAVVAYGVIAAGLLLSGLTGVAQAVIVLRSLWHDSRATAA